MRITIKTVVTLVMLICAMVYCSAALAFFDSHPETVIAGGVIVTDYYAYGSGDEVLYVEVYKNGEHVGNRNIPRPYQYNHIRWKTSPQDAGSVYSFKAWIGLSNDPDTVVSSPEYSEDVFVLDSNFRLTDVTAQQQIYNIGDTVIWDISAENCLSNEYYCSYTIYDAESAQKITSSSSYSLQFSYAFSAPGQYYLIANIRDNENDIYPHQNEAYFANSLVTVVDPECPQVVSLSSENTAGEIGCTNRWAASARGGTGDLRYCFTLYNGSSIYQTFGPQQSPFIDVILTEAGKYTMHVAVEDSLGNRSSEAVSDPFIATQEDLVIARIASDRTVCEIGESVKFTVETAGGGQEKEYYFALYKDESLYHTYGWIQSDSVTAVLEEVGQYTVQIRVRDEDGRQTPYHTSKPVEAVNLVPRLHAINISDSSCDATETIRWYAVASGGEGMLEYHYTLFLDGTEYEDLGWHTQSYQEYTFRDGGTYTMRIEARDSNGRRSQEQTSAEVSVHDSFPVVSSITGSGENKTGATYTWTAEGEKSSHADRESHFQFRLYHGNELIRETDWLEDDNSYGQGDCSFSYTFDQSGDYYVEVRIRDKDGDLSEFVTSQKVTVDSMPVVTGVSCGANVIRAGQNYLWKAEVDGGNGALEYQFSVYKHDHSGYIDYGLRLIKTYKWSARSTFSFIEEYASSYQSHAISVKVRDADGDVSEEFFSPEFYVTSAPVIRTITTEKTKCFINEENTWTLNAATGVSTNNYYYSLYRGTELYKTFPATTKETFSYTFTEPGSYALHVYATDTECTSKTAISDPIVVTDPSPVIDAVVPGYALLGVGQSNLWTVYVEDNPTGLEYYFRLYKDGIPYKTIGWMSENVCSYTFSESGRYAMQVRVSDSAGYTSAFSISAITVVETEETTPLPVAPTPTPTLTPIPTPTPTPLPSEVIVTLPNTQMLMTLPYGYTVSSSSYSTSDSNYPTHITMGQGNSGESLSTWLSRLESSGYTASLGYYGGMEGIYAWKEELGRSTYIGAFYYKALGNITHSLIADSLTSVQLDNFREIILTIRAKPSTTPTPTPDPAATPIPDITIGTNHISMRSGQEAKVLFAAPKKGFYRFYTTGEKDTRGYLYNKELTQLATDDDSGDRHNFLLSRELNAGEHVYVGIRFSTGDNVPYQIPLVVEYTRFPLVILGTQNISIAAGKTVTRAFVSPEDGVYTFYTTGDNDTIGYLEDENQNQLAYDDDSGSGRNFQISYKLKAGQLVNVNMRFYSTSASGYISLNIACTPQPTPEPTQTPELTFTPEPTATPDPRMDFVIDQNGMLERYEGEDTVVIVPQDVTGIGEYAFQGCSGITSVELPDGVTSIGEFAFSNCDRLAHILIPDSVTSIAGFAFYSCPKDMIIRSSVGAYARTYAAAHSFIWEHDQHTPAVLAAVEPTCTETGLTEGCWCSSCGEIFTAQEIIDSPGHTEIIDEAAAPTCTETGLTEGKHCSACSEVLIAQEIISATGHSIRFAQSVYETDVSTSSNLIGILFDCGHPADWIAHVSDNLTLTTQSSNAITVSGNAPGVGHLDVETNDEFRSRSSCQIIIHAANQLVLPSALTEITDEAFASLITEEVVLSDKVKRIGARAFADCANLALINLPDGVEIAEDTFIGCKKLTILCTEGSTGHAYAEAHKISYLILPSSIDAE